MVNKVQPSLVGNFGIFRGFTLNRRIESEVANLRISQIIRTSSAEDTILKATRVDSQFIQKIEWSTDVLKSDEIIKQATEENFRIISLKNRSLFLERY